MSGAGFSVGEVAVYNRPESKFHGMDVVVTGPLAQRYWSDPLGRGGGGWCYRISIAGLDDDFIVAEPHELRKRRPPQDWVKLCRLTDRPVEEPA